MHPTRFICTVRPDVRVSLRSALQRLKLTAAAASVAVCCGPGRYGGPTVWLTARSPSRHPERPAHRREWTACEVRRVERRFAATARKHHLQHRLRPYAKQVLRQRRRTASTTTCPLCTSVLPLPSLDVQVRSSSDHHRSGLLHSGDGPHRLGQRTHCVSAGSVGMLSCHISMRARLAMLVSQQRLCLRDCLDVAGVQGACSSQLANHARRAPEALCLFAACCLSCRWGEVSNHGSWALLGCSTRLLCHWQRSRDRYCIQQCPMLRCSSTPVPESDLIAKHPVSCHTNIKLLGGWNMPPHTLLNSAIAAPFVSSPCSVAAAECPCPTNAVALHTRA